MDDIIEQLRSERDFAREEWHRMTAERNKMNREIGRLRAEIKVLQAEKYSLREHYERVICELRAEMEWMQAEIKRLHALFLSDCQK